MPESWGQGIDWLVSCHHWRQTLVSYHARANERHLEGRTIQKCLQHPEDTSFACGQISRLRWPANFGRLQESRPPANRQMMPDSFSRASGSTSPTRSLPN
jgi:hypothetical protein